MNYISFNCINAAQPAANSNGYSCYSSAHSNALISRVERTFFSVCYILITYDDSYTNDNQSSFASKICFYLTLIFTCYTAQRVVLLFLISVKYLLPIQEIWALENNFYCRNCVYVPTYTTIFCLHSNCCKDLCLTFLYGVRFDFCFNPSYCKLVWWEKLWNPVLRKEHTS